MSTRTPTTDAIIAPSTVEEWQTIANELAAEVTRLHNEIDRLKGGDQKAPLASHADWTHPLYAKWIELGLDDVSRLGSAWLAVAMRAECVSCGGPLHDGPYPPFTQCDACQLCFIVTDGHFALDTVERAMDRGPDA